MTIKRLKSRLFIIVLFFLLTISYTSAQDLVKKGKWSGSIKGMLGATPLLGTTDINVLNRGTSCLEYSINSK